MNLPRTAADRMAAALHEVGYGHLAVVLYSSPGGAQVGFLWERLGRVPTLDEVEAVHKARSLVLGPKFMGAGEWYELIVDVFG